MIASPKLARPEQAAEDLISPRRQTPINADKLLVVDRRHQRPTAFRNLPVAGASLQSAPILRIYSNLRQVCAKIDYQASLA
jgi:hypothetical protein